MRRTSRSPVSRARAGGRVYRRWGELAVVLWYCLLAVGILWPLWQIDGVALLLDWTPTPFGLVDSGGALHTHGVPLDAALNAAGGLVPVWLLQRLILFGALAGAGIAAHATAPVGQFHARLFAGTLYLVNPFTMSRLGAGHWRILVAYALAPLAARAIVSLARRPSRRAGIVAGVWIASITLISAHFIMLGLLLASGFVVSLRARRALTSRSFGAAAIVAVVGVLWWGVPALMADIPSGAGEGALEVFRSTATGESSTLVSVLGLRGFWVEALTPTAPPVWPWLVLLLLGLVFTGAALAARDDRRIHVVVMFPAMIIATVLAVGVSGELSRPIVEVMYRWVPGLVGFRESHKLLALLAIGYAWFGAVALDRPAASPGPRGRLAGILLLTLAVAYPIAATPQIFDGASGRVRAAVYPASWHEARRMLAADPAPGTTLILPWKQYVRLPFVETPTPVADPLRRFLSVSALASEDPLLGPGSSPHTDPSRRAADRLLAGREAPSDLGMELARLDVKYIALVPSSNPDAYGFLFEQPELSVLLRSPDLILFRNKAWMAPACAPPDPAGPCPE